MSPGFVAIFTHLPRLEGVGYKLPSAADIDGLNVVLHITVAIKHMCQKIKNARNDPNQSPISCFSL